MHSSQGQRLLAKIGLSGSWGGVGQAVGTVIAASAGASHPAFWGAATASVLALGAVVGLLPGAERKPHADLERCLNMLGRMLIANQLREAEYERLRARCLDDFERVTHER